MVNPKCSPESVARNLYQRTNEAFEAMTEAYAEFIHNSTEVNRLSYNTMRDKYHRAKDDEQHFKALHPSAFMFEEVEA